VPHLNQRDVTFVAISRAFGEAPGFRGASWVGFNWLSSSGSDFNFDFNVSFTPEAIASGNAVYNYAANKMSMQELPGISVFFKSPDGRFFTPIPAMRVASTC
jgi:predicted dithiol-disulfide oxidoreductase (DUF899 family)